MARAQAAAKKPEKTGSIYVVSRTTDGYHVYSPEDPTQVFHVAGTADRPECDCEEIAKQSHGPGWRCEHINTVFGTRATKAAKTDPEPETPNLKAQVSEPEAPPNGKGATMLLKRSVSPDGRIDSLSVEISFPIGKGTTKDVRLKAMKTLKLQGEITAGFLAQNGRKETHPEHSHENHRNGNGNQNGNSAPDGAEPARMLEIGGMNTKWGRRLYIAFQVNGDMYKLFGNQKKLEEVLTTVGQSRLVNRLQEGLKINAPCLVTTKQTNDGRYTNIDEVFPPEKQAAERRGR